LHAAGINDFDAWRADEMRDGIRFPVLLHGERDHNGPIGDLIRDRDALRRRLDELAAAGAVLGQILVIEFCETRDPDGLYRGLGTFRVGDRFTHRFMYHSADWRVKERNSSVGSELSPAAIVDEEEAFILSDEIPREVPDVFRLAQIDYGRMDYALKDGGIRVWEINTCPMLGNPEILRPGIEIYDRYYGLVFERMREALLALEGDHGDDPFWIEPVYQRRHPRRPGARVPASRAAARWRRIFGR